MELFGKLKAVEALKGKRILIVDDSSIERKVHEKVVTELGCIADCAEDSQAAIVKLRKNIPDLILMDCDMPGKTGIEFTRQLKEEEGFSGIPVIFITSIDTPTNIIDCFESDAENYLSKPVNPRILAKEIQQILSEKD